MKYAIHFRSEKINDSNNVIVEVEPDHGSDEDLCKRIAEILHIPEVMKLWKAFDITNPTQNTVKVFEMTYCNQNIEVAVHAPEKYRIQIKVITKYLAVKLQRP